MDAIEMIKERRSVRRYKDTPVDREIMKEIIEISRFAPSWSNLQIARYTLIDDRKIIERLGKESVHGFTYNVKTLKEASGVAILSFIKGKSGKIGKDEYATSKDSTWEVFDTGIACQTFCLAAHAKGVGTVIMGVINDESVSEIVGMPKEETVAALIVYGYEEGDHRPATPRLEAEEIMRFAN